MNVANLNPTSSSVPLKVQGKAGANLNPILYEQFSTCKVANMHSHRVAICIEMHRVVTTNLVDEWRYCRKIERLGWKDITT